MPYKYVEPEIFVETPRGTVYHAYNDGWWDDPLFYQYTTDPLERDEFVFDVRDLAPGAKISTWEDMKRIIVRNCTRLRFPED